MEHVQKHLAQLHELKDIVKRKDNRYFRYTCINYNDITDKTISIFSAKGTGDIVKRK